MSAPLAGLCPGPGDHHHLNGVVQPGLTHCGADVPPHFRAQGVAHLRTVEGKIQNSVPYLIQNIFKFHVQPHSFPLSAVLPACVASCKGKRYSKILQQFLCQVSNCRPADGRAAPLWVSIKVSAVFCPAECELLCRASAKVRKTTAQLHRLKRAIAQLLCAVWTNKTAQLRHPLYFLDKSTGLEHRNFFAFSRKFMKKGTFFLQTKNPQKFLSLF